MLESHGQKKIRKACWLICDALKRLMVVDNANVKGRQLESVVMLLEEAIDNIQCRILEEKEKNA